MSQPGRRSRLTALGCSLALLGAACGSDAEQAPSPVEDAAGDDAAGQDAAGDDAAGTTMRVYTVGEAIALEAEGSVHVSGLLIDDGSGWRLCDEVLESYPPQCGGDALRLEGFDPTGLPLEESGEVRWQTEGTVVGEIDGDTLVVTGSPASS
ncbi:MAG: hypothetical protein ACQEUI_07390 [Actinomycetota bacterium]